MTNQTPSWLWLLAFVTEHHHGSLLPSWWTVYKAIPCPLLRETPANLPHRQSSILVISQKEGRKETMRQVPEPGAVPSFQGLVRWNTFILLRLFMNLGLSRPPAALLMPGICIHFCRYSNGFWGTTFNDKKVSHPAQGCYSATEGQSGGANWPSLRVFLSANVLPVRTKYGKEWCKEHFRCHWPSALRMHSSTGIGEQFWKEPTGSLISPPRQRQRR